jgi:hypothetical protein
VKARDALLAFLFSALLDQHVYGCDTGIKQQHFLR